MDFRFTKYASKNALLSLIPVFPAWTLFPGMFVAMALQQVSNNCEASYRTVLWFSITITMLLMALYMYLIDKILLKTEHTVKRNFRLWNAAIYTFSNTAAFITIIGVNLACHGDGQTALACIYSGPVASVLLIVFGFAIDVKIYFTRKTHLYEKQNLS